MAHCIALWLYSVSLARGLLKPVLCGGCVACYLSECLTVNRYKCNLFSVARGLGNACAEQDATELTVQPLLLSL